MVRCRFLFISYAFPMVSLGFLMVSNCSISFMCLPKVSSQNPPCALWPRMVVSAPNIMRELCGIHTLQPPPNFSPTAQLPSLSPTSQPFPSFPCFRNFPPSAQPWLQFPTDVLWFPNGFPWCHVDLPRCTYGFL